VCIFRKLLEQDFLQARCNSCCSTNSISALKGISVILLMCKFYFKLFYFSRQAFTDVIEFNLWFISACQHGYYGVGCRRRCRCDNNASCDTETGDCVCPAGRTGLHCEQRL